MPKIEYIIEKHWASLEDKYFIKFYPVHLHDPKYITNKGLVVPGERKFWDIPKCIGYCRTVREAIRVLKKVRPGAVRSYKDKRIFLADY